MSCGDWLLIVELRAGARLFLYPQQVGGTKWHLTGARITPVSLDKICERMLADGMLEATDGDDGTRGEYKLSWLATK